MLSTRDIALYGAIVATFSGLWNLYAGAVLDRARVRVRVWESWIVSAGPVEMPKVPTISLNVSNRSRRPVTIQSIARVVNPRKPIGREMSRDFAYQVPKRLNEGEGHSFVHGAEGGYGFGEMPLKRWYVVDGAGRVHPLGERWRQRVERVALWPWRRRDRQSAGDE